jgi:hypothetical protein
MTVSDWTESDSAKARIIWSDYQSQHDLSEQIGQTAGIDPVSGQVWLGDSIEAVVEKREADGIDSPLFFERVGSLSFAFGDHRQSRTPTWTSNDAVSPVTAPVTARSYAAAQRRASNKRLKRQGSAGIACRNVLEFGHEVRN